MSRQQLENRESIAASNGDGNGLHPYPPEAPPRHGRAFRSNTFTGPLITVGLVLGAEALQLAGFELPAVTALMLLGILVSAFTGNVFSVIASSLIAFLYAVWHVPPQGVITGASFVQPLVISDALIIATFAWLSVWLRRNLLATGHLDRLNRELGERVSWLKRENTTLRERVDDLQDFVDHATLGLHRVDSRGVIVWANQAELDLLGYTAEEYIGRHVSEFHADPPVIEDILTRLSSDEELHSREARLLAKDGSIRHVLISSNVLRRNGKFIHTRCFTRDVTAMKLAQLAKEEHEHQLELIFHGSSQAIFVADEQGRYIDANRSACELLGYSRDELLDLSIADLLLEQDLEAAGAAIAELNNGGSARGEWRLKARDGRLLTIEYAAMRLDTGSLVSFVTDITEQRKQDLARQAAERQAAAIQSEQRAQSLLGRLLAEAGGINEVAPAVLELLCAHTESQFAALWLLDEFGTLRSIASHSTVEGTEEFAEITRNIALKRGSGLPGRVAESGLPSWSFEISTDRNFPRAPYAQRAGFVSAFAVPLMSAAGPVGVIDFLYQQQRTPTDTLIDFAADAGHRIGTFLEREQSREALRTEAQRSRALFDQAGVGAAQTDVEGQLIAVNDRFSEMLGYSRQDLLGRSLRELVHPNHAARYILELGLLWAGDNEHMEQELQLQHSSGAAVRAALSVSVVRDESGEALYTVAVVQDISERVMAMQRAREQQEYLRAVIENSPMSLASVDNKGVYQIFIGNALEPLGITAEKRIGLSIYDVHSDNPETVDAYEHALAGETINFVRREKGMAVNILITPHRNAEGDIVGAVALATDITGQKHAEDALLASEARFRDLLFALPTAIYTTDADGVITLFNEEAAELWGRRPVVGEDLWCGSWKIARPDGSALPLDECPMAVTLRTGKPVRGEAIIVERPDGSKRHVLPYPQPLRDSSGGLTGAVNMLIDITERKEAEDRLRRAELRLSATLELAPLILVEIDRTGIIELVIGAGLNETSADPGANVGKSIYETSRETPERIALYERALAGETVETLLVQDGLAFKALLAPKYDAQGELDGVVSVLTSVSDLYRTQQALQESEERLRDLVQTSQDLIFSVDAEGTWTFVNDAAEEIYGYKPDEMIGRPFWEVLPESEQQHAQQRHSQVQVGQSWFQHEVKHVRKDGTLIDLIFTSKVRNDADGKVIGVTGTASDITERKKAELRLREREAFLSSVLDNSSMILTLIDRDGIIRLAMGSRTTSLGVKPAELTGKSVHELYGKYEDATGLFQKALAGEHNTMQLALGDLLYHVTVSPYRDSHGEIVGVIGVSTDITELNLAEAQLRESEERLRTVLDNAPLIMVLLDKEGRRELVLGSLAVDLGSDTENLIGRSILEDYADRPDILEPIRSALSGVPVTATLEAGGYVLHTHSAPRYDSNGNLHGAVVTGLDITDRRRAERALEESRARLSGIVSSAMDAIITVDADQRITLFNKAAEQMFGYNAVDLIDAPLDILLPERFRAGHSEQIRQFGATGVTSRSMGGLTALAALRANGEEFPIEASISQVEINGNKLYTVILRDVTQRQRDEAVLREAEARFRALSDSATALLWMTDAQGNAEWYSNAWLEFSGRTLEQELADGWPDILHPEDRERAASTCLAAMAERKQFRMTFRMRRHDGEYRWFLDHGLPRFDSAGNYAGYIGSCIDITGKLDDLRPAAEIDDSLDSLPINVARDAELTDVKTK